MRRMMTLRMALAPLAAALGLSAGPAAAASFGFSYVFETGDSVDGMLDGDVSATDPNLVENAKVTMLVINGVTPFVGDIVTAPDLSFAFFPDSDTVSFDGSDVDLAVFGTVEFPGPVLLLLDSDGPNSSGLFSTLGSVSELVFEPSRWTLTPKAPIPEPGAATLFGLGGLIVASRTRRLRR